MRKWDDGQYVWRFRSRSEFVCMIRWRIKKRKLRHENRNRKLLSRRQFAAMNRQIKRKTKIKWLSNSRRAIH